MSEKQLSFRLGPVILTILLVMACHEISTPEGVVHEWPVYSADNAGSKYSPLKTINRENVHKLQPVWIYRCGDKRLAPASTIECNPLVKNGIMYLSTPGLKVVALDAASGQRLWFFDPYDGRESSGVNRGLSYWTDGTQERLFYVAGSNLYCLNASSGKLVESFGKQGMVDLYEGLGRDVRSMWVTATTPGIVYRNLLILGSALGEGPSPAAPGHIRAYDVLSGAMVWIFHTIPQPGEYGYKTWPPDAWNRVGGANAWGGFTLDEKTGIVFCGTGSAAYDHWGGDRAGQNLFANCILALNASTGERIWHYQVVHHDIWDYDIPCPPNLVQVKQGDELVDAVAQPTKMGQLYVLERKTGTPIYPIEEMPVPASDIPGEETWPTQPFPPVALRYASQRFDGTRVTDLSEAARKNVLEKIKGMKMGDIFIPPGREGTVVLPQFNGGTDWGGAAYHPEKRLLFVNCSNEAEWISMVESQPTEKISKYDLGRGHYRSLCSSCHGFSSARNPGSPSLTSLQGLVAQKSVDEIHRILRNGKGQMPKFANLTTDERDAIIAFLRSEGKEDILNRKELDLSFSANLPYVATGHRELRDAEGFPANNRPWGTLNAIDLDQGKIIWQVALGTYPALEARGFAPTGTFNMGGPIATGGGLVFIGAGMDERFRAFDQETGTVLWEYQLDAGAYATPATYEVDGKQYVVIAAGGGGKPGTTPGDAYYCFALPE